MKLALEAKPTFDRPMEQAAASTQGLLSVMMPIYNEERTVEACLQLVLAQPEVGEVIAVDDGSTDASWKILQRMADANPIVRPIQQASNQGKGAALRRAIDEVRLPITSVSSNLFWRAAPRSSTATGLFPCTT